MTSIPRSQRSDVERVAEAVGIDPLVLGSDFPHGAGLHDPSVHALMRGNMGRFLGLAV